MEGPQKMTANKEEIISRLTETRKEVLNRFPFYGDLLMKLKFTMAPCKTAATDMRRLIFDPLFVERISDEELEFTMIHEVLHCVLQHVIRSKGKNPMLFNVAADTVVNSIILYSTGRSDFWIDGCKLMHTTPDGKEGHLFSVEEVYEQLTKKYANLISDVDSLLEEIESSYGVTIDDHGIWNIVPLESSLPDEWKKILIVAARSVGSLADVPQSVRSVIEDYEHEARLDWKGILRDFIHITCDTYDYTFLPNDRRFSEDFIIPSFSEVTGNAIEDLWFLVDTSGSISKEMLSVVWEEIKNAISLFSHFKGQISFFDTSVTEPQAFDDFEGLNEIKPVGGGGTSFKAIFEYLKDNMEDTLPVAIVIMTDGEALYPEEEESMGIPVLWILVDNQTDAPWGQTVHLSMD